MLSENFLRDFFGMPRGDGRKPEAYLVEWKSRDGKPYKTLIRQHESALAYIRDNELKNAVIVPLVRS